MAHKAWVRDQLPRMVSVIPFSSMRRGDASHQEEEEEEVDVEIMEY